MADFGTILPLLLAVSLVCGMDLPLMVTGIGICYILCGIYYRIPVSVEPLKVVASIAIAQHLLPEEIAAAGILTGLVFIGIGLTGMMGYLQERIPEPVIRGIQLGLGLILLRTAVTDFAIKSPVLTAVFIGVILLFLFLTWRYHTPDLSAILVIVSGFGILFLTNGLPGVDSLPVPHLAIPPVTALVSAGLFIVPAQFPLTLTNAILSTSLLISDLYKRTIPPDRLSITVGMMSLALSVTGAFPSCHGAGGVAAHYRFGARTGYAIIFGGFILVTMAILFSDPRIPSHLPPGMFGALLIFVAVELIKTAMKSSSRMVTWGMAIAAVIGGMAPAFVLGLAIAYAEPWLRSLVKGE